MKRVIFLAFIILFSGIVIAKIGYDNPNIPKIERTDIPTSGTLGGGNSTWNESYASSLYFKLDASNDPITGTLDLESNFNMSSGTFYHEFTDKVAYTLWQAGGFVNVFNIDTLNKHFFMNGSVNVSSYIRSYSDEWCNSSNCYSIDNFLNDTDTIFNNSNVCYLNESNDFSEQNNFTSNLTILSYIEFNETKGGAPTFGWNGSCFIMQPSPSSGSLVVCG